MLRSSLRPRLLPGCRLFYPVATVALLAFSATPQGLWAFGSFSASTSVSVLDGRRCATGDFNNDGIPDVAVPNKAPGTVSVLLGNADGTLQSAVSYPAGAAAYAAAVADIDGDGRIDLVVANQLETVVSVLRGNGDGTFAAKVDHAVPTPAWDVVVADVNHDGRIDIITANHDSQVVTVLMNSGSGSFNAPVSYGANGAGALATGDFNGDGRTDLAVANVDAAYVSVLLASTTVAGTFDPAFTVATGGAARYVCAADFNSDGKMDLATCSEHTGNVSVLLGVGDGNFQTKVDYATSASPTSIAAADFNQDGYVDLFVAHLTGSTVGLLFGAGDGTFAGLQTITAGAAPFHAESADFNRDGLPDIVSININANSVSVLLNNQIHRSQAFTPAAEVAATSFYLDSIAAGDIDRDGHPDLIASGNPPHVSLGNGDNTFRSGVNLSNVNAPGNTVLVDVNRDGKLDVIIPQGGTPNIAIGRGNGDGTFQPFLYSNVGYNPKHVAVDDLNNDGKLDLVSAMDPGGSPPLSVSFGNGDGSFQTAVNYLLGRSICLSVATGDFNGDGWKDVAAIGGTSGSRNLYIFLNNGAGTLGTPTELPLSSQAASIVISDFNNDGKLDLAVADSNSSDHRVVNIYMGDGNGAFSATVVLSAGAAGQHYGNKGAVDAADVNGDGNQDVVTTNNYSNNITIYLGNGNGTFAQPILYPTGVSYPQSLAIADLSGDGRPDILCGGWNSQKVVRFVNIGGQFSLATTSIAPSAVANNSTAGMLKITATHAGRSGENSISLSALHLGIDDGAGTPLTSTQLSNLVSAVKVYFDADANGTFSAVTDGLIASFSETTLDADGRALLQLPTADPRCQVAHGTPKTYFVALTTTPDASSQIPASARLTHVTSASSKAVDTSSGAPLRLQSTADVSTPAGGTPLPVNLSSFTAE